MELESRIVVKQFISRIYNFLKGSEFPSGNELDQQKTGTANFIQEPSDVMDNQFLKVEANLKEAFKRYNTSNLDNISALEFRSYLESKLGQIDFASEGYSKDELDRQRDLSVKFHWGHNHDFGDFYLPGRMGDRHINLLTNFCTFFPVSPDDFNGKATLDVGCWTGGTTLLLVALGSHVTAIEEVNKYIEIVSFLTKSFGVQSTVDTLPKSLYQCNQPDLFDKFDIVYFPGVIYHLSDPLLALRILYNTCKVGGIILVESAGIDEKEPYCLFEGSQIYHDGNREEMNRSGWNWFLPSPSALYRLLREAGFDDVKTLYNSVDNRVYGYAKKVSQVSICRAGLSVPDIR